jgi:predicted lysophospholipase L1 biosynthesis ABC-type transport system permease subunit
VTENVAWTSVPQAPINLMTASIRQLPQFSVSGPLTLVVRTSGDPDALVGSVRETILAVDPALPFHFVGTMEDVLASTLSAQRMGALLLSAFGTLALVLALVGVGGVVSYIVGRQKREIGIRIALGATRTSVQMTALQQMILPIGVGLGAGLVLSLALGRTLQRFLIDAKAEDPLTYAAAASLLALATLLAVWLPTRRASGVDPTKVLKAE